MRAGMVDKVHVMHARGAGRHAGEAGEATVNMFDDIGGGGFAAFQHIFDHINAPTRAIEFVAEQEISRAGRGAEAAMDAGTENFLRGLHGGFLKRFGQKTGLHG